LNLLSQNQEIIRRATATGAGAVLLWSSLAVLATASGPVPPFQMVAMAFALAFALAVGKWVVRGESIRGHLQLDRRLWALGIVGLFGYHACYFAALRLAPPVEANLINYLWPLLIVLFAGLLPGERLTAWHIGGALAGLAGCVALIGTRSLGGVQAEYIGGYAAAAAAAVIWAGYSVLSRRFGSVPTDAVGAFCGATAVLAFVAHVAFERTYWPQGGEWLAVLGLGLGPVGAAFFLWDVGMKRGDIKALGALSYATPLLSTLLLIAFDRAALSLRLAVACLLIVGGAALASRDLWRRR
jgi:drug/metabolite transporter (DMT)-like permease